MPIHSSGGDFGARRVCLPVRPAKLLAVLPHDRRCRFQANAAGAALINEGALGNSFDDLLWSYLFKFKRIEEKYLINQS